MKVDIWHYSRSTLAKQVLGMFESGLSSALIFFAPRRMGKTEFLLKDMATAAKKNKWHVLYFSFLDVSKTVIYTIEKFISAKVVLVV
jgi:predicted AAA+ superfamily ATPase